MVYFSDLNNRILIEEVKKRPCLYVKEHPKYNDIVYEQSMWAAIGEKIFHSDWCEYTEEEKASQACVLSKRWQSIREQFLYAHKQKLRMHYGICPSQKSREFRYYNDVEFLSPYVKITLSDTKNSASALLPFVPYAGIKCDTTKIADPTGSEFCSTIDDTWNPDLDNDSSFPAPEPPNHVIDSNVKSADSKKKIKRNKGKASNVKRVNGQHAIYNKKQQQDWVKFALSLVPMLQMLPAHKNAEVKRDIKVALRQCLSDTNDSNDKMADVQNSRQLRNRNNGGSSFKSNSGRG